MFKGYLILKKGERVITKLFTKIFTLMAIFVMFLFLLAFNRVAYAGELLVYSSTTMFVAIMGLLGYTSIFGPSSVKSRSEIDDLNNDLIPEKVITYRNGQKDTLFSKQVVSFGGEVVDTSYSKTYFNNGLASPILTPLRLEPEVFRKPLDSLVLLRSNYFSGVDSTSKKEYN